MPGARVYDYLHVFTTLLSQTISAMIIAVPARVPRAIDRIRRTETEHTQKKAVAGGATNFRLQTVRSAQATCVGYFPAGSSIAVVHSNWNSRHRQNLHSAYIKA